MPEQKKPNPIIRTEVVVVESMDYDKYGNLLFKDKEGRDHKLGEKRIHLADQIVEGRAVELGYAEYMNKEYIADCKLVETQLPPPEKPKKIESSIPKTEHKPEAKHEIAPQAIGMTTKEVGDLIRAKMLTEVFKETAPKANAWYKSQMLHNMGIAIESPLVKTAKQLGATEEPQE